MFVRLAAAVALLSVTSKSEKVGRREAVLPAGWMVSLCFSSEFVRQEPRRLSSVHTIGTEDDE